MEINAERIRSHVEEMLARMPEPRRSMQDVSEQLCQAAVLAINCLTNNLQCGQPDIEIASAATLLQWNFEYAHCDCGGEEFPEDFE